MADDRVSTGTKLVPMQGLPVFHTSLSSAFCFYQILLIKANDSRIQNMEMYRTFYFYFWTHTFEIIETAYSYFWTHFKSSNEFTVIAIFEYIWNHQMNVQLLYVLQQIILKSYTDS